MKILLTGANGFIGSHLLPALMANGHDVHVVTRPGTDLSDADSVERLRPSLEHIDVLIHLAAKIPSSSIPSDAAEEMNRANVESMRNILGILPPTVKHVILASTLDVYGPPITLPLTEDHPLHPQTAYAQSKVESERIATDLCAKSQIPLTILRFTQVYGPRENPIKAIPRFIDAIAHDREPVLFGDGNDKRDYLYVSDAVQSIMLAIKHRPQHIINIATGTSHTIAETVEALIKISGKELLVRHEERQKPTIDISFDIARAREFLHFSPAVSLYDGLALTYDWYLAQKL